MRKQQQSEQQSVPSKDTELAMHTNPRASVKVINPMDQANAVASAAPASTNPMEQANAVASAAPASTQDSMPAVAETLGDAGGQWEMHMDKASGEAYYYNSATGETSWELPPGKPSAEKWTKH